MIPNSAPQGPEFGSVRGRTEVIGEGKEPKWRYLPSKHSRPDMIRKLRAGKYRLYSRKINPKTGKRRNLGTFSTRGAAEKHEREVQYFKRH
jgi:hypothetical protein